MYYQKLQTFCLGLFADFIHIPLVFHTYPSRISQYTHITLPPVGTDYGTVFVWVDAVGSLIVLYIVHQYQEKERKKTIVVSSSHPQYGTPKGITQESIVHDGEFLHVYITTTESIVSTKSTTTTTTVSSPSFKIKKYILLHDACQCPCDTIFQTETTTIATSESFIQSGGIYIVQFGIGVVGIDFINGTTIGIGK